MTKAVVNNENGAQSSNVSDRTVLVAALLSPNLPASLEQVIAIYHAATGRIVSDDVMRATLHDATQRGMITYVKDCGWKLLISYWDELTRKTVDAIKAAASPESPNA